MVTFKVQGTTCGFKRLAFSLHLDPTMSEGWSEEDPWNESAVQIKLDLLEPW